MRDHLRVLLIGPLVANAGHGAEVGIYDALVELGHDVICFDPRVNRFIAEYDDVTPVFGTFGELANQIPDWDVVLCSGPGLPPKLHELGALDLVNGLKVMWNSEPIRLANYRERVSAQKDSFDVIATFDESELPLYEKMGVEAFFLPQAFNPQWYKPLHDTPVLDFAFVGSVGGKWQNRIPFIRAVGHICDKNGWTFDVCQTFDAKMVNSIYNSARVVLNLGLYHQEQGPPGAFRSYALQQRIFEAIGAGRVTLTHDFGSETNQVLTPHEDVVTYDGPENLEWAMSYARTYWDDLADNIKRVRDQHSYRARMEQLTEYVRSRED